MRFNLLRSRGGLVRKHVPTKLDWNLVDKRNLADGPPPPPTPKDPAALDPNAPPPKDPAVADPEDPNTPPSPGGGPKKPKGPPGNGTEPVQPNGVPPPNPGKGPKKEKTPPPNPTASAPGTIPTPLPTSGASPTLPLPSESAGLGPVPTSLPPPPPTPKTPTPKPTAAPPPGPPGPKGNKPPPPPPIPQSTLSTSIIAATAAPESLPVTTGGGINSNTGTSNGAVVNTNATASQGNRAQSQATIAVSVVVIIVGSIALIVGCIFLLRHIMRRRRLGVRKEEYLTPSPPPIPPMQSYPAVKADGEYLPQFNRGISYPVEHYTEAYAPVIMEGRDFNIRRKTVGLRGEGPRDYQEKALSNMPASVMSEATLQDRNSMANAYPRDVKVPPVQMPRDI